MNDCVCKFCRTIGLFLYGGVEVTKQELKFYIKVDHIMNSQGGIKNISIPPLNIL